MAMNWVVWPGDATACAAGMIAIEVMVPPALPPLEPVTVKTALETAGPRNAGAVAVMVVVPAPTAVATPAELTVATAGALEVHVTVAVIFCVVALEAFP